MRGGLRYGHFRFTEHEGRDARRAGAGHSGLRHHIQRERRLCRDARSDLHDVGQPRFRAANAFDFGAIGLSGGAGFEISPQRAVELGGVRGSTDGATAISTGQIVGDLDPERLMAYEAGIRWRTGRVSTSVTAFDLEFHDAIERRTLIFPSSIVGLDLSGYTVIRQDDIGRAYVAGEARPIVTRVNVSRSRILGYEAETNVQIIDAAARAGAGRRWRAAPSSKPTCRAAACRPAWAARR